MKNLIEYINESILDTDKVVKSKTKDAIYIKFSKKYSIKSGYAAEDFCKFYNCESQESYIDTIFGSLRHQYDRAFRFAEDRDLEVKLKTLFGDKILDYITRNLYIIVKTSMDEYLIWDEREQWWVEIDAKLEK